MSAPLLPAAASGRLAPEPLATGAPAGSELVSVEGLRVSFPLPGERRGRLVAVEDVSFGLEAGETLGLVGESGCGKTTVARCLVGLQRPDRGSVRLGGRELGPSRSREDHRAIQLVFQDPYASLNPRLSVRSTLTELLKVHGLARGQAARNRCRELMALVGMPADALEGYPAAFSGGQRQRIAIARALAVDPRVLVADEPISALDVSIQATILSLFASLRERLGIAVVLISHNLAAVRQVCDRVAVMYLGRIVELGEREQVFADARHPYTKALLAAAPRIRPDAELARVALKGEPPGASDRPAGCPFHPRCPRAEAICTREFPELLPVDAGSAHVAACHFRGEHP